MFNLFTLSFLAIVFALVLAALITRRPLPKGTLLVLPEEASQFDPKDRPALTLSDLELVGQSLCEHNKLEVVDRIEQTANEAFWIARSDNPFFYGNYVFGFHELTEDHPYSTLEDILNFKDFIKGAGASKGFYFSNGYFTRDVLQPLEGPKVSLYNRIDVLHEIDALRKRRIDLQEAKSDKV